MAAAGSAGAAPPAVVPSPKSQPNVSALPAPPEDALASNATGSGAAPVVGDAEGRATGAPGGPGVAVGRGVGAAAVVVAPEPLPDAAVAVARGVGTGAGSPAATGTNAGTA